MCVASCTDQFRATVLNEVGVFAGEADQAKGIRLKVFGRCQVKRLNTTILQEATGDGPCH